MKLSDASLDAAFEKFMADSPEIAAPDFSPLFEKYPEHREALQKKIDAYRMIQGMFDEHMKGRREVPSVLTGREFDGIKILEKIGQGGMGAAYLARQEKLNRDVIVKILHAFASDTPSMRERFHRESRIIAKLDHPHIVPVYDVGEAFDSPYIVMKRIPGMPLAELIGKLRGGERGRLDMASVAAVLDTTPGKLAAKSPTEFFCRLVARIAGAVEHAHRQGVFHRDIKPSNILVEPDGNPVLLDFGMSHDNREIQLTVAGEYVGTPTYSAPETLDSGPNAPDLARADVYSLGVTLYEALTTNLPYDGRNVFEICRNIRDNEPVPPRRYWKEIPRDLETVVLTAIAKAPERRYATAQALRDDLENFLDYRPIAAKPPTAAQKIRFFLRRHKLAATAAFLVVALLALSGYAAWDRQTKERRIALETSRTLLSEAKIAAANGEYAQALQQLEQAAALDPDGAKPLLALVKLKLDFNRDLDRALDENARLLARFPDSAAALDNQALLLELTGKTADAVAIERRALALEPREVRHLEHLAARLAHLGRDDEVENAVRKGLDLDKYNDALRSLLLETYENSGREKEYKAFLKEQKKIGGREVINRRHGVVFRAPFLWYEFSDTLSNHVVGYRAPAATHAEVNNPPSLSFHVLDGVTTEAQLRDTEAAWAAEEFGTITERKILDRQTDPWPGVTGEVTVVYGQARIKALEKAYFRDGKAYLLLLTAPESSFKRHKTDFDLALSTFGFRK